MLEMEGLEPAHADGAASAPNGAGEQAEVLGLLSRSEAYGVARVERIETHISYVFLAGDRAYKLKRAVRLPFLDFSATELRRRACEAELRFNRQFAPKLYLRVMPVTRGRGRRMTRAAQRHPSTGAAPSPPSPAGSCAGSPQASKVSRVAAPRLAARPPVLEITLIPSRPAGGGLDGREFSWPN